MELTDRSPRRWLRWLTICGAAATAIIVAIVIIVAAGPGSSPPVKSKPAARAVQRPPVGPVTLIPGTRVINGVQLGFPHTTVGAISAAADLVSEVYTLDPSHASAVARLMADSSVPELIHDAALGAGSLRKEVGISPTGPVPAGYSAHIVAVEYQVRNVTANKVMVILLCDFAYTKPGGKVYSTIGVLPFLMHWERGDWKDAGYTDPAYMSLIAQPDSAKAASLGWKPLRPPRV